MTDTVPAFAIVGRVNKGKSSVVSTLVEDDSVRVDKEPGTTRVCARFPFRADDGRVLCYAIDTPGFEEAPRALAWLQEREQSAADRPALVARFVETFMHCHGWCNLLGDNLHSCMSSHTALHLGL